MLSGAHGSIEPFPIVLELLGAGIIIGSVVLATFLIIMNVPEMGAGVSSTRTTGPVGTRSTPEPTLSVRRKGEIQTGC